MSIVSATHGAQLSLLPHDGRTRAVHTSEEFDVYAGRPRGGRNPCTLPPGAYGWLGNPHEVGRECRRCGRWHALDEALVLFARYFLERLDEEPSFYTAVLALKGKRLGCPGCPTGSPCHAKIIAAWVERATLEIRCPGCHCAPHAGPCPTMLPANDGRERLPCPCDRHGESEECAP